MIINISGNIIEISDKYYEKTIEGLKIAKENILDMLNQDLQNYIPKDIKYKLSSPELGISYVYQTLTDILYMIDKIKIENNTMILSKTMLSNGINPILRMYCGYRLTDMNSKEVTIIDMFRCYNWRLGQ